MFLITHFQVISTKYGGEVFLQVCGYVSKQFLKASFNNGNRGVLGVVHNHQKIKIHITKNCCKCIISGVSLIHSEENAKQKYVDAKNSFTTVKNTLVVYKKETSKHFASVIKLQGNKSKIG